jgi:ferredoxin
VSVVVDRRCTACGLCLLTCPERALLPAPGRPRVVDDRCTTCLACVEVCPVDAITEARPLGATAEVVWCAGTVPEVRPLDASPTRPSGPGLR